MCRKGRCLEVNEREVCDRNDNNKLAKSMMQGFGILVNC